MSSGKSYDQPLVITYGGLHDFGGATDTTEIKIPAGKGRFRIEEISVSGTEVFTAGGKIELGDGTDPNKYGELSIGTLAASAGLNVDPDVGLFDIGHGGKGVVDIATEALTEITVTLTTATTTGIGFVAIVIGWW